ncbi:MAG: response regulator, partial [Anaerolineales bacterium]|nr:response regulator [Anaerolineales bacterium]
MARDFAYILIIDSDASSRNYLSVFLQQQGHRTLLAASGKEGLVFAWRDRPDIIIFDPAFPDIPAVDFVDRLRKDARTAQTVCIALAQREHFQERNALLAAGCNEYLVKSGEALQQLKKQIARALGQESSPSYRGKSIVFLSAKGGSGVSSLCANLATCVAEKQKEKTIVVVDLVLPIGSIANIVGYDGTINIVNVALQKDQTIPPAYFRENLPRIPAWRFALLAGAPDPEMANNLPADRVPAILEMLLKSYDYVFIDLGKSLSRISLPIIQQADLIVLILGTDRATATLTKITLDFLHARGVDCLLYTSPSP